MNNAPVPYTAKCVETVTFQLGQHLFVPHYLLEDVYVTTGGRCAQRSALVRHGATQATLSLWERNYDGVVARAANRVHDRDGTSLVRHWFSFGEMT